MCEIIICSFQFQILFLLMNIFSKTDRNFVLAKFVKKYFYCMCLIETRFCAVENDFHKSIVIKIIEKITIWIVQCMKLDHKILVHKILVHNILVHNKFLTVNDLIFIERKMFNFVILHVIKLRNFMNRRDMNIKLRRVHTFIISIDNFQFVDIT